MTFIEEFERELVSLIEDTGTPTSEIARWASEKVLESYRNGITAGQKGATVKRQGKSRRRSTLGRVALATRSDAERDGLIPVATLPRD